MPRLSVSAFFGDTSGETMISDQTSQPTDAIDLVDDGAFSRLISERSQIVLGICSRLGSCTHPLDALTRPCLGELLSQSTQLEELLDAYGAGHNRRWYPFRSLVASIKLFSDVGYELRHIRHVLPLYKLLPIEQDFSHASDEALAFTGRVLLNAAGSLLDRQQLIER